MTDKPVKWRPEEAFGISMQDSLYPKSYDYEYPPQSPTAYNARTFAKWQELFNQESPKAQEERGRFLKRNTQRMSVNDLDNTIMDDMLSRHSALLTEALRNNNGRVLLTGLNTEKVDEGERLGATKYENGDIWASQNNYMPGGISVAGHELLHKYLWGLADDRAVPQEVSGNSGGSVSPEDVLNSLYSVDDQHSLIDVANQKISGIDDQYDHGKYHERLYDALEKMAQNRIGSRISKQNQGRISSK